MEIKIDPDQEDRWVIQMKEILESHGEHKEKNELPASIFRAPGELLKVKPEAYIPECISIGPYHHRVSALQGTLRHKVCAARRFMKSIPGERNFEYVVQEVMVCDWQLRNCYHAYLDYNKKPLAWLMALDACFLLECLRCFPVTNDPSQVPSEVNLWRILDPSGRSAIHKSIMRDLMKLENQIPLFLLQKLLELQFGCQYKAEETLSKLVSRACREWSPFMLKKGNSSRVCVKGRCHILEVIYYSIVPAAAFEDAISMKTNKEGSALLPDSAALKRFHDLIKRLRKLLSWLGVRLIKFSSALAKLALKGKRAAMALQLCEDACRMGNESDGETDEAEEEKDEETEHSSSETPPVPDELPIPSVSELHSAGVKFLPTDGDVSRVRYDPATATLYLPKLRIDYHTDVVLRNLVAFEASAAPGALIFRRYADFMNGIIDTDEDVRLLRKSGIIIYNNLEDDGQVGSLWNSICKCVKMTHVRYLDQVIEDVNKHYNSRLNVSVTKYLNKYIYDSWKLLALLATGIVLLLSCLEAICSVLELDYKKINPLNG